MVVANEGLPTLVTLIALVIVMDAQMKPIGAAMAEALPTDTTEVGLLSTVDPQMFP